MVKTARQFPAPPAPNEPLHRLNPHGAHYAARSVHRQPGAAIKQRFMKGFYAGGFSLLRAGVVSSATGSTREFDIGTSLS